MDSIKSPTNAIREIKIPYKIPIKKGFSQFNIKAKNNANKIEQDIPPIKPSTVLLGDIGERGLLPNDFPIKKEPISLATIKKHEVNVKYKPVVFVMFSNEIKP